MRHKAGRARWSALHVMGAVVLCTTGLGVLSGQLDRSLADAQVETTSSSVQAQRLLQSRCAVCHSLDLVTQQRLNPSRWKATVAKMRHWGAQLSDEEEQVLTDYLAAQFSPDVQEAGPAELEGFAPPTVAGGPAAERPHGNARRGEGLYARNCLPCHGQAATGGMGPKLAAMPILGDESRFWETVVRGRGPMPAWGGTLAAQEIADIHAWLSSLR